MRGGRTRVGGFAGALQEVLEAQEVLLAHGARVVVVLPAAELCELHQHDLNPEQRPGVDAVEALRGARRGVHAGLEPDDAGGLRNGAHSSERLGADAAGCAEHRPAAVDDLGVPKPVGVDEAAGALGVGESEGVEAEVAGVRAIEVAEGLLGWEEEGIAGAVDLNRTRGESTNSKAGGLMKNVI